MIHNPFSNPKFAVSMVVFFLLVTALFYNTSSQIVSRMTNNLAATSRSNVAQPVNAKYCKDFSKSLLNKFSSASNRRKADLTLKERQDLARCHEVGLLRTSVVYRGGAGEGGLAGGSSCPSDLNGDAQVDGLDLNIVIANWGSAGPGDINGNGSVGVDDLLIVISAWGPCSGSYPTSGNILRVPMTPSLVDESGYSNNASSQGASCSTTGCQISSANQSVTISPVANDFDSSQGTIALVVKPSFDINTGIYGTIFSVGLNDSNVVQIYYGTQNDSYVAQYVGAGIDKRVTFPYSSLPQNTESHLAMTWGGGQLKVYINGNLVGTASDISVWSGQPTVNVLGNSSSGQDPFVGSVKNIGVWNRALTSSEVSQLASGGTTTPPPPPSGPVCGNGVIEGTEQCDGTNLGNATCSSVVTGSTGTLSCNTNTCTFNTAQCTVPPTGNPEIAVEWQNGSTWTNINDGATSAINFGTVTQNSTGPTRTFRIRNTGTSNLTFSSISVPTGYTVTSQPTSPVAPNGNAQFVVRMNTGTQGTFQGQILFTNNDANESPFNFAVTGAVTGGQSGVAAEIALSWNNNGTYVNINDGQTSPVINFGSVAQGATGPTVRFRIRNEAPTGAANLTFNNPSVPFGYTVTSQATSPVAPGAFSDFIVRLDSAAVGTKTGQISFTNNDSNETPFNFDITGSVTSGGGSLPNCGSGSLGGGNYQHSNCLLQSSGDAINSSGNSLSLNGVTLRSGIVSSPPADQGYGIYSGGFNFVNISNSDLYADNGSNDYTIRGTINSWTSNNSRFANDGDNKAVWRIYGLSNGTSNNDTFEGERMMLGGGYASEFGTPGPFQNFLFEDTTINISSMDIFGATNNVRFKGVDFLDTGHISIWSGAHHIWFEDVTNLPRLRIDGVNYDSPCSLPSSFSGPPWYISIVGTCN